MNAKAKKFLSVLLSMFVFVGVITTPVLATEAEPEEEVLVEETEVAAEEEAQEETAEPTEEIAEAEEQPAAEEEPAIETEPVIAETEIEPVEEEAGEITLERPELELDLEPGIMPMAEEDGDGEANDVYDVPEHSKTLTDNGDGTYTLSLSVTGSGKSDTEQPKANVVFVMDRSGSMSNNNSYTGESGYYVYTGSGNNNNYGYVNGNYVALTYRNGNYYYTSGGQSVSYSGPRFRYSNNLRRDQVAIAAATNLVDSLLNHNTSASTDTVEISFVSFNDMASNGNGGNWTTSRTTAENVVAGYSGVDGTGTNWEDALIHAKTLADAKHNAQPNEPMYVIFLTDGNPTRYVNNRGNQAGTGYETDDNIATCYNEASPRALALTDAGYNLYNIGVFGNVDRMVDLTADANAATAEGHGTAKYYPASNSAALQAAFDEILASITDSLALADIKFTDGVTGMTSSAGVNGKPGGFKYTMTANGETTTWAAAPEATVDENNVVTWDLSVDKDGNELIIADGVTVTCSFIVWPSQEAQDLVADLNNGVKKYSELTAEEKAQIISQGATPDEGPFTLKTNTDFPTLDYSIVKTVQVEGQEPRKDIIPQPQIEIENPDPVGLAGAMLNAVKLWEDSLDGGAQRAEEIDDVTLYLKVGDDYYYKEDGEPVGLTLTEESNWTKTDYIYVAPGLMVTEASPAYDPEAPHVTWEGVTYAILESGHDYVFEESKINNHYELTAYTHHPMIMGVENGKPVVKDVVFTKGADGSITGIESVADLNDTISATNTLKGGINIAKKTVDAEGNDFDTNLPFTVTVNLTDEEGNALPVKKASDGTEYTIDYRIYYGKHNPAYNPAYDPVSNDNRSAHIYKSGTSFEETLYVGDIIRVVNVENGALYNVTETLADGSAFELDTIDYTIGYGQETPAAYTDEDKVVKGETTWYKVKGNSASNVTVVNKLAPSFFIYHSGVADDGNLEIIPMSAVNADGTYDLYAHTTPGTLYGGYYLDYAGKGNYNDDGIISDGGVVYSGMNYDWSSPETVIGTAMKPVAYETYYIKEVPTYYLRNYHQINYMKNNGALKAMYLISAVDDLNYQETGLTISDGNKKANVASKMTFKNYSTNKSVTLKANTVFKSIGITGTGSEKDYLTYIDATTTEYFKVGNFTVLPYWKTPDGIEVHGISTRTITIKSLTKSGVTKSDS